MDVKNITRREWMVFALMLILVPLAGEPQFHPFTGDFAEFRVSFGSPIFLLFLLWLSSFPRLFTGAAAGIAVMVFRTGLDMFFGAPFTVALTAHVPNFFYYFIYALFFFLPQPSRDGLSRQALSIAAWAIVAEVFASVGELAAMNAIGYDQHLRFSLPMLLRLLFIAVLRCFFILSFFFLFQLYSAEVRLERRAKEQRRLTTLIANLYEEVFELKMSLSSAENVTRDCYTVYDELKTRAHDGRDEELAREVLRIAGECHEIKKNHQRIYAGLLELTNNRHVSDYLPPDRIVAILLHTQDKYARAKDKQIFFTSHVPTGLVPLNVFLLLSILNNLVANAIEAIDRAGTIDIVVEGGHGDDKLFIKVENTGSHIPARRLERIFAPGYTTKFDSTGKASSGVGLTYVKHQTETLGGTINITSDGVNTVTCTIVFPCHKLHKLQKEDDHHEHNAN